ncbi:MAG: hypothetical protein GY930_00365 [bacterium]|nr:hypothetical protein [bacterium]
MKYKATKSPVILPTDLGFIRLEKDQTIDVTGPIDGEHLLIHDEHDYDRHATWFRWPRYQGDLVALGPSAFDL